jgi:DNA adenine methylase
MKQEKQGVKIAMKTPITYYGGKQQMLRHILPLIPEHRIYVEPFLGGGAVFWAKEPAPVEFVNDKNGEVVNFYAVLKTHFRELAKMISATLHSEGQQKAARQIYLHPDSHSDVERAWALWTLSHQSIYAILTNSWRCSKDRNQAAQLQGTKEAFTEAYSKRLERTSIFCRDALDVIRRADHEDAFIYIDPPYFNADMGHYGGYTFGDYENLLALLMQVRGKFMLSSYPSDVLDSYAAKAGWQTLRFEMSRCAGGGRKTECLTLNYDPPAAAAIPANLAA